MHRGGGPLDGQRKGISTEGVFMDMDVKGCFSDGFAGGSNEFNHDHSLDPNMEKETCPSF
jgi:hypothetical protein